MRLVLTSDTHGCHRGLTLPEGDVFIHAGDFSKRGRLREIEDFADWLDRLDFAHKIVVAGNHDLLFEEEPALAESYLSSVCYLKDKATVIDGVHFYGSPWQPRFFDWAFNLDRGPELAAKWALIPTKTDVLITHGPPAGILDKTTYGALAGCVDLFDAVLRVRPRLHVFGHIHEAAGRMEQEGITFINASAMNAVHQLENAQVQVYDV